VLFEVERIAGLCKAHRIPFHCDGTQAPGKIPWTSSPPASTQ
jgi:cysteine sulfinate desulfinase/cysteine desulfurase-like protein